MRDKMNIFFPSEKKCQCLTVDLRVRFVQNIKCVSKIESFNNFSLKQQSYNEDRSPEDL